MNTNYSVVRPDEKDIEGFFGQKLCAANASWIKVEKVGFVCGSGAAVPQYSIVMLHCTLKVTRTTAIMFLYGTPAKSG
jgi:hypothetical protein